MKFRYARHTNDLEKLTAFYTDIIGLSELGRFHDHAGYDGIFFGIEGADWHIEFTQSEEKVNHHPDRDDLIVLYCSSNAEIKCIQDRAEANGIFPVTSQNPYWNEHGIELTDPDGFGVILTKGKEQEA